MCKGMQVRRNPLLRADMKQTFYGQDGLSCYRTHPPAPAGLAIVAALEAKFIQSRAATSPIKPIKAADSAASAPPPQISPIPTSRFAESASSATSRFAESASSSTSSSSTTQSLPIPTSSSSSSSADEKACIESDNKMENWINKKKKKNRFSDYSRNKNDNYKRNNSESFCNGGGAKKSLFFTSLSPPDYYIKTCNFHNSFGRPSPADFLGACFFCNRSLGPGKDIYMYRGDRAFCSADCRYKQIVADESLSYRIPIDR